MSVEWRRQRWDGGMPGQGLAGAQGKPPRALGVGGEGCRCPRKEGGRMQQRGGRKLHAAWEKVGNRRALHSLVGL